MLHRVKYYFEDEDFDAQYARTLGKTASGMAEVGECLAAAANIKPGDDESWFAAWTSLAQNLESQAESAVTGVSKSAKYLRASEYYRAAFFYNRADLADPKLRSSYPAHVHCFREALSGLPFEIEPVEIAFETCTLTGYFFKPSDGQSKLPTIVVPGGYDSTAEELFPVGLAAIQRGINALVFDGPGQGATLYERGVPMRPDYETVSPAINDYVLSRPDVEPSQLAWMGRSFGGVLVPRAVFGDSRVAAMIVDPGQYDLFAGITKRFPPEMVSQLDDDTDEARQQFEGLLGIPRLAKLFGPRMTTHGLDSVWAYLNDMRRYNVRDQAPNIHCPSLVADNEFDPVSTGQGQMLYDALMCQKDFHRFTAAEGAGGHCEGAGQLVFFEYAFDWLTKTLVSEAA